MFLCFFGKENILKRVLIKSLNVMLGFGIEIEEIILMLLIKSLEWFVFVVVFVILKFRV